MKKKTIIIMRKTCLQVA